LVVFGRLDILAVIRRSQKMFCFSRIVQVTKTSNELKVVVGMGITQAEAQGMILTLIANIEGHNGFGFLWEGKDCSQKGKSSQEFGSIKHYHIFLQSL